MFEKKTSTIRVSRGIHVSVVCVCVAKEWPKWYVLTRKKKKWFLIKLETDIQKPTFKYSTMFYVCSRFIKTPLKMNELIEKEFF